MNIGNIGAVTGHLLLISATLLLLLPVRRLSPLPRGVALVVCVGIGLARIGDLRLIAYPAGVLGDLSITTQILLAVAVVKRVAGVDVLPAADRSFLLAAAASTGLLLYSLSSGLTALDMYSLGFGSGAFMVVLALATILCWRYRPGAALVILFGVLAFDLVFSRRPTFGTICWIPRWSFSLGHGGSASYCAGRCAGSGRPSEATTDHDAMMARAFRTRLWWPSLLVVAVLTYLYSLGGLHIPHIGDEAPYIQIVRLTAESDQWLPLRTPPGLENTKPPLLFWLGMVVTDWARQWTLFRLRFPITLFTFLTSWLVFLLARRVAEDTEAGYLAALSFLGFASTLQYGRPFLTNIPETLFAFLPFFLFIYFRDRIASWGISFWIGVGLSVGLACLFKSFVLIVRWGLPSLGALSRSVAGISRPFSKETPPSWPRHY